MPLQTSSRPRRRTGRKRAFEHVGTVQVGGEAICYQTRGDVELARQTVVLLHGIAADSSVWKELVGGLPPSYYVIALDLPGHGQSQGKGRSSVAEYAGFLASFLDALGVLRPVVMVGHCLGGAIALEVAHQMPERVSGLVVSGLGTGPLIEAEVLEALERGEVTDEFVARRLSSPAAAELATDELLRWHRTRPEVRYADAIASLSYVAESRQATGPDVPMLMVGAEADRVVPVDQVWQLQDQYPGAQVRLLPDAGHLSMLEQPGLYRTALEGFLGKLVAEPPVPRAWI